MEQKHSKVVIYNYMDIANPKAGGAEKYCFEIAKRLVAEGKNVVWVSSRFKGSKRFEIINGIQVRRISSIPLLVFSHIFIIPELGSVDFVFENVNVFPFFLIFFFRRRIISMNHLLVSKEVLRKKSSILWPFLYFIQNVLSPRIYKENLVLANSQSTKDEMLKLGYKNVVAVRLGVDIYKGVYKKENLVISPGLVKPWKHHDHVIKAFSRVKTNWNLVIFGEFENLQWKNHIYNLLVDLNLSDRVKILGKISEETKVSLYKKGKFALFASEKEGLGLSALEPQGFGCPVIAYNVPGVRDCVINNKNGLLIEFGDLDSFADAINRLITDNELLMRMSYSATDYAKEFTWDNAFLDFKKALENI